MPIIKAQASSSLSSFYRLRYKMMVCLILLLALPISSFALKANTQNIQDHNLKAVYLFRFAFLTTWGRLPLVIKNSIFALKHHQI